MENAAVRVGKLLYMNSVSVFSKASFCFERARATFLGQKCQQQANATNTGVCVCEIFIYVNANVFVYLTRLTKLFQKRVCPAAMFIFMPQWVVNGAKNSTARCGKIALIAWNYVVRAH
jgi:hypothetical protein